MLTCVVNCLTSVKLRDPCIQCTYAAANFFIIMGNVFNFSVALVLIRLTAASQIFIAKKKKKTIIVT